MAENIIIPAFGLLKGLRIVGRGTVVAMPAAPDVGEDKDGDIK